MEPTRPTRADNFFGRFALFILAIAAIMIAYLVIGINKTNYKVRETAAYTRASNCIVARLASDSIKQKEIEDCYVQVEKGSGISLERFDKQTNSD